MKLSKRLQMIADMIPSGVRVIDVGCDHALLDIYLTLNKTNECIASDINENVLKKTREMIRRHHLEEQIQVVQGDGLENIWVQEEDIVVIAGMGTATILHILEKQHPKSLIIETHNHLTELRKEISRKGYVIEKEEVVFDKNIYYVIIKFQEGISNYNDQELFLGPVLMQKRNSETTSYFEYLLRKKQKLNNIPKAKLMQIDEEIIYLKTVLNK